MVVVAVAGGTGDLGKTVVEELALARLHKVLILGRKIKLPATHNADEPDFVVVNYDDIEGTAKILESNNVHTVVSVLAVVGPGENSQLNLIAAADQSVATQRFIPSEFTGYVQDTNSATDKDEMNGPILRARMALSMTRLKMTRFSNGFFMDYFGHPNIPSTLRPFKWAIDVPSRRAAIPGTGNEVLSMTHSRDVGRYIARLIDDEEWPEFSNLSGADTCLNEIVALAEKITGEKFQVTYDGAERLRAGEATSVSADATTFGENDASMVAAMLGNAVIDGKWEIPKDGRLNDRYPELKPMSIEDMITAAWSKKGDIQ